MIQAPIDYSIKAEDPAASFGKWYNIGNGIRQNGLAEQQAEQAKIDAAAKAESDAADQAKLNESLTRIYAGQGSPEDQAFVTTKYDAQKIKAIQEGFQKLTPDQRQNNALQAAQLKNLLEGGNIEQAKKFMVDQAEAARNSGDEQRAKAIETMFHDVVDTGDVGVKSAILTLGTTLSTFDEGRKTLQNQWDAKKAERDAAAAPGDRAKTDAETKKLLAETAKMAADEERAKLEANRPPTVELTNDALKIINTAVDSAMASDLLASQTNNLANEFEKSKPPSGWAGTAADWFKKAVGGQDKLTSLRQEYVKLRNTDVLRNLPPGVASDKDIEIALKAFPDENANPGYITAFLRGTAKLQSYSSAINKAKAQWVNQNGSLGPARGSFTIGKSPVSKGMNFWEFTAATPVPNIAAVTPSSASGQVVEGDF